MGLNVPYVVYFSAIASVVEAHVVMDLPAFLARFLPRAAPPPAAVADSVVMTRAAYKFLAASPLHLAYLGALFVTGAYGTRVALKRGSSADKASAGLFVAGWAALAGFVLPNEAVLQAASSSAELQRDSLAKAGIGHIAIVATSLAGLYLQLTGAEKDKTA